MPNFQSFNDATQAYDDYFIQKIVVAIVKVASIKEIRIKHNFQEWCDDVLGKAIKNCDLKVIQTFFKI